MNNLSFTNSAWQEYCYWQMQDKKTLKRINLLLTDIQRNSFERNWQTRTIKGKLKRLLEQKD